MWRQITSLAVAVLGLVSLGFADTDVAAGATPASGTNPKPAGVRVFQEGSTRPPAALAGSPRAAALNAAARLTVESGLAFDRGDSQAGRAKARAAVDLLKSAGDGLKKAGDNRARSKLAAARGRLQLDFVGDNTAAERALQDAVNEDDNPAALRRLVELVEREERAKGGARNPTPGN